MRTRKTIAASQKIDWLEKYYDKQAIDHICTELLMHGLSDFKGTYVIQNLEQLESLLFNINSKRISAKEFGQKLSIFMHNDLVDTIRICIFFENFMKALLLSKGIIVHQIKSERMKPLAKKQNRRPVESKYLLQCHFKSQELSDQTIGLGVMLNSRYQEVIKLPEDILSIVREINSSRNELHFRADVEFQYSHSTVADLRKLKEFVEPWMQRLIEASKSNGGD